MLPASSAASIISVQHFARLRPERAAAWFLADGQPCPRGTPLSDPEIRERQPPRAHSPMRHAQPGMRFRKAERVSTFSEHRLAWLVDHTKRRSEKVLTRSAPYIDSCALRSVFIKRYLALREKRSASRSKSQPCAQQGLCSGPAGTQRWLRREVARLRRRSYAQRGDCRGAPSRVRLGSGQERRHAARCGRSSRSARTAACSWRRGRRACSSGRTKGTAQAWLFLTFRVTYAKAKRDPTILPRAGADALLFALVKGGRDSCRLR
jgi:hypothetical protein